MKIGTFSGAFSPFPHPGHIWAMQQAVEAGVCERIIALLQTDPSVERPSKRRPELTVEERKKMLFAIRYVYDVFTYTTQAEQVAYYEQCPPDVIVLGEDWKDRHPFEESLGIPIFWANRRTGWSGTEFADRIAAARGGR